jgi:hypothetical protein
MAITASHEKRVERWDEWPIVAYMFTKRQSGESYEYWLLSLSGNCCLIQEIFQTGALAIFGKEITGSRH